MASFYRMSLNQDEPHFLHACSLCRKPLGFNSDIFMYRGNTPFCSKECRQEQIQIDEATEKSQKLSSSARSLMKSESKTSSTTTTTPARKNVRTGTVVVA
ncbi:hypothetical protein SLE2022_177220 [Rubroshorea leprosula]